VEFGIRYPAPENSNNNGKGMVFFMIVLNLADEFLALESKKAVNS
jgi:hypothetical protein